jgi:hypothetical protein
MFTTLYARPFSPGTTFRFAIVAINDFGRRLVLLASLAIFENFVCSFLSQTAHGRDGIGPLFFAIAVVSRTQKLFPFLPAIR